MGRLREALIARAPDILHVMDSRLHRHGPLLSRLARRPWVLSLDGRLSERRPRTGGRLGALLVGGRAPRDELVTIRHVPRDLLRIVPPGVDLGRYPDPTRPFLEGRPVIGAMARFDEEAGLVDLARAVLMLVHAGMEPHLLLAGHGPAEPRLRRFVRELGLERHVTVTALPAGFERVLATVDVFVMPSVVAWSGTEILQALAAARPVVAAGVGITFSIVREAETGFLAPRRSPRALADRIRRLLEDPELASSMGRAGREDAETRFGIDAAARGVERVYR
ncbi:MAG: glycosyltransferase family 4 protein, partial [Planctomycetota bacterium]